MVNQTPWLYEEWENSPRLRGYCYGQLIRGRKADLLFTPGGDTFIRPLADAELHQDRLSITLCFINLDHYLRGN